MVSRCCINYAHSAPCAQNDKINVLHEPYFGTHILGNHLPFQTSEIPKKNTKPLISIRGLAFDKLLQSSEKWKFHSFKVSLRETLAWVGSKPNFTIMICDFVCNVCGKQFKSKKHSLNLTGMSTLKKIFLAHCVKKHSEQKSILLITSSANTQKRNLCSVTSNLMTLNTAIIPI